MGKPAVILAAVLLAIFLFFPKTLVLGASLQKPIFKPRTAAGLENHIQLADKSDDEIHDFDYDFMNNPYGPGYPRDFRAMQQRHERMLKRIRRGIDQPGFFE